MQGALPLVLTRRLLALVATVVLAPTVTYTVFTALAGTLRGPAGIWDYVVQTFWHFDLGVSSRYRVPLTEVIGFTWPMDLTLIVGGILCGMVLGLAGGVTVVTRAGSKTAVALQVATALLLSSPPYLLGFALLLLFAPGTGYVVELPFLSRLEEYGDMPHTLWGWIHELWLPWLLVGLPLAAQVLRMTASGIRDALGEDFVRTARAKGLAPGRIVRRHALPWAVAPIAALTAANMAIVITNVTLVESAFNLPGLFREVRDVQSYSDTPTVQALIIEATVLIVVANMLADAVQARLDPSVRR